MKAAVIVRALEHPWEDPKDVNTSGCIWGEEAGGGQGPEGRRVEKGKGSGEVKEATSIAKNLRKKSEMKNQSRKIIKTY